MARGPAGYGRYADDPQCIGCPRAQTDMTPCVARDGHAALDGYACVGCGQRPGHLLHELATVYAPAAIAPPGVTVVNAAAHADRLAEMVRAATEPATGAPERP